MSSLTSKDPLIIIDGYGFVFRAYHVQPPLTAPDGRPAGAIYGFTSMLLKLINDLNPTNAVVVLDSGQKNYRHEIYKEYKAHRPPAPDDLVAQLSFIRDSAKALNFKVLEQPGFEADDIIATLAKQAVAKKKEAIIVSSDKDLMQLMNTHIKMYDPAKSKFLGDEDVLKKFGVGPDKVREVQALMGDKSDNIPGVPGVGPKTASELIMQFGDLDGIYASIDKIKSAKQQEKLINAKDDAYLSWQLVGLADDVEIEQQIDELVWNAPDAKLLGDFLNDFGFKSLFKRAENLFGIQLNQNIATPKVKEQAPSRKSKIVDVKSTDDLKEIIAKLHDAGLVGVYMQDDLVILTNNGDTAYIVNISTDGGGTKKGETMDMFSAPKEPASSPYLPILAELFANDTIKKVTYDMKSICSQELLSCHSGPRAGISGSMGDADLSHEILKQVQDDTMGTVRDDTMGTVHDNTIEASESLKDENALASFEDLKLMEYLFSAGSKQLDLSAMILEYLGREVAEDDHTNLAASIIPLYKHLKSELVQQKLFHLYKGLDVPSFAILREMEKAGVKIDVPALKKLSDEFAEGAAKLEQHIHKLAGEEFNVASPKQLGEVLFDKMGLPHGKVSGKSGAYTTSSEVLEKLSIEGHEIADLILQFRHFTKLKNTYTDALPKLADKESRIHTTYSQSSTATSRLSSKDPNVQNIPVRTEEGNKIRGCFIAEKGHKLISADYSQIELRILSHVADIPALQEAFKNGEDIHARTASQIFDVPIEKIDPELRRRAKAINFGIIYGISSFGLAKQLGCSRSDAKRYIERYFEEYPGIKQYMDNTIEYAKKHGYVENLWGRRCHIPAINSKSFAQKSYAERAAINAPLQSMNADIVKVAMIDCQKLFSEESLKTKILLQIHDELIFETPEDELEKVMPMIKQVMESAINLKVPTTVDVRSGSSWLEAH